MHAVRCGTFEDRAGAQPIKTKYSWLMIYHGVDKDRFTGWVMVIHLDQPERVIYRSPNPILTPETEYEIGRPGESWVPVWSLPVERYRRKIKRSGSRG